MAFDYDEKDMNDSTSKKIDLDQYGVWVKKPPRNVEETSKEQSNGTKNEIVQEESLDDILPNIDKIELDTTSLESSPIDDFETIAQAETSDLTSLADFEEQPIEDFFLDEKKSDSSQEFDDGEIPLETFIDADFLDDFSTTIIDEKQSTEEETVQEPTDIDTETPEEESIFQNEVTLVPDYTEDDDFDPFPEQAAQNEPQIDTELPTDFTEEKLSFIDETMPVMENFTDAEGNPVTGESFSEGEESVEEEINIDDFLNDDEVSPDEFLTESGEISLDEFMDTPSTEKNDILDEAPMDMNLSFDDDYAVKTATDPVNQMEDSFTIEEIDDFDEMFDNIVDESQPQVENEQAVEEPEERPVTTEMTFDEVNDFDDFLSEFAEPKSSSKAYEPPKEFDLTVTMDEEGSIGSEVTDIVDNEENSENITLKSEEEKNNKNEESSIARLQFSDYTDRSYSSDDFDVDKIMAEVEDIGEKTEEIQEYVAQESPETSTDSRESTDYSMEKPEEVMEFNQNEPSEVSRTEELINSIAGEIALLRNEISNLRNEFELFKVGKASADENSVVGQKPQEEKSSGGFFADDNDDDTISLSGDELSNIFNTADFTEESVDVDTQQADEDSDNGLPSMDFDSESLEEPIIEDNYFEDDDFPAEIDVPTGIVAQEEQIFEEIELEEEDQGTEEVFEETETTEVDFPEDNYELSEQADKFSEEEIVDPFEEISEEVLDDAIVEPAFDSSDDILEEEVTESVEEEVTEPEETVEEATEFAEEEVTEPEVTVEEVAEPIEEEVTEFEETVEETTEFAEEEVTEPEVTVEEVAEPIEEEVTEPEETVEETTESGMDETMEAVETEEEMSDEPVESVFESNQWEAPVIDETMGFADTTTEELTEEVSESGVFADDPLIIEEPVDTITSAEEELLEELAVIPVIDDELPAETLVEETLDEEPVGEDVVELTEATAEEPVKKESKISDIPDDLKQDIKSVLSYMDQLLDSLPEDKIAEFARSEHFELYKKLFTELGL